MTEKEFIDRIKKRLSIIAVGASALRNQGAPGIVEKSRNYFYGISLDEYFKKLPHQDKYSKFLDDHTTQLVKTYPKDGKSWGAARKGLNLFFREVAYNKFFSDHYKLPTEYIKFNEAVKHLEVPLDKDVAKGIYNDKKGILPKWTSIKKLTKEDSDLYQKEALNIAQKARTARINLDIKYWRQ